MTAAITLRKAYGDGSYYETMTVSGTGFTASGTVSANAVTVDSLATEHDEISIDSDGNFSDARVYLPRLSTRGDKTVSVTDSGAQTATSTYTVQYCNSTTPEKVGRTNSFAPQSGTSYFTTETDVTTSEAEEIIRGVEEEFYRATGRPLRPLRIKDGEGYFDTDGSRLTFIRHRPIKTVVSAKYWAGSWETVTSDDWDDEVNDDVAFWYDNRGFVHWVNNWPRAKQRGLYMDFVEGYDDIPFDIVQAVELRVGAIMQSSEAYVKLIKRADEGLTIDSRQTAKNKVWTDCIARHRRLDWVGY